jgi:hypothetical protein
MGWQQVESSWNVMAHGDAQEGKWRGNWRMGWVTSTLHTTSEHGVSSITTADARTSAASSRLNWRPRRFKWTRLFSRKTKSGFCACAITFQTQSNNRYCSYKVTTPHISPHTMYTNSARREGGQCCGPTQAAQPGGGGQRNYNCKWQKMWLFVFKNMKLTEVKLNNFFF